MNLPEGLSTPGATAHTIPARIWLYQKDQNVSREQIHPQQLSPIPNTNSRCLYRIVSLRFYESGAHSVQEMLSQSGADEYPNGTRGDRDTALSMLLLMLLQNPLQAWITHWRCPE